VAVVLVVCLVLAWLVVRSTERSAAVAPHEARAATEQAPPDEPVADQIAHLRGMLKVLEDNQVAGVADPADAQRLRKRMEKAQQAQRAKSRPPVPRAGSPAPGPKGPIGFVRFGPRGEGERDFHASAEQNGVTIEVRGTVVDRTVSVKSISIREGPRQRTFERLCDVPADEREAVQGVIDRVTRGRARP
jgi:hypothetical protein